MTEAAVFFALPLWSKSLDGWEQRKKGWGTVWKIVRDSVKNGHGSQHENDQVKREEWPGQHENSWRKEQVCW